MKAIILKSSAFLLFGLCCAASSELPQFRINPADLSAWSYKLINRGSSFPTNEELVIRMTLSRAKADEFQTFTKAHVKEKAQIFFGTNLVSEPVIESQVMDGKLVLHCPVDRFVYLKEAFAN